jgi:ribonucleoside-triphosphate reductase (thioredoxin)
MPRQPFNNLPTGNFQRMSFTQSVSPFVSPIQQVQYADKYARWRDDLQRRETWNETVDRVMTFFERAVPNAKLAYGETTWHELRSSLFHLKALPSMRALQMAGPAAERENLCLYNCAMRAIDSFEAFAEILYVLMQGTGCSFSVERQFVDKLPVIATPDKTFTPITYVVDDSTEGWTRALRDGLLMWAKGGDYVFDYSRVRAAGTPLKTKGGYASGPQPLNELLVFARNKIRHAGYQRRKLTTLECHDIACRIGWIVQVGGTRRAAMLSLSDLDDESLQRAKFGSDWFDKAPWRSMSNNSAVYDTNVTQAAFDAEWASLAASGTGERGIFNRAGAQMQVPLRRQQRAKFKQVQYGVNPCAEIVLEPIGGLCNLSIAVARDGDTEETLKAKVRLATLFGTLQSACTNFNFPFFAPHWKENAERERLLGVDITGQLDCPLLQPSNPNRVKLLQELKQVAIAANRWAARQLEIAESVAITCVKPSGNSSQFLDAASGIHPRFARFYIRRMRFGSVSPMAKYLRDLGVPCYPDLGSSTLDEAQTWVFEFPVKAPDRAIVSNDMTALDQLQNWLDWKQHYTEHSVSCTIQVADDEWDIVKSWVKMHWKHITGLSFLPKTSHVYDLAPYEAISEGEYMGRLAEFPIIDLSELQAYEQSDTRNVALDYACVSGVCAL